MTSQHNHCAAYAANLLTYYAANFFNFVFRRNDRLNISITARRNANNNRNSVETEGKTSP